jgi:membrane protein
MPTKRRRWAAVGRVSGGLWCHRAMKDELVRIGKRFASDIGRDDVAGMSAELAYRFLFAVFPFGIFVAALSAFVAGAVGIQDPTQQLMGAIRDNLPPDIANAIEPQIQQVIGTVRPSLLTLGAILALWAATAGTNALIKAMNRAFETEEHRPLVPRYALAIGLTLLASIGILVAFVTIVGASLLTGQVVQQLHLDQAVVNVIGLLRWPVVFVLVSIAASILYKLAPAVSIPFRWCLGAGALFAIAWVVATALFGLYVANFANYSNTYGALGGVIALMLWFYLSAFVLVAAAALMAAAMKETRPEQIGRHETAAAGQTRRAPSPVAAPRALVPPAAAASAATAANSTTAKPTRRQTGAAPRPMRAGHRPVRWPNPSPPEDWALAASVAGFGATLGVLIAALIEGPQRRLR